MAERRMFAKTITESDAFLDMPLSAQALYFHLSMNADDDGFVNSPKKIQRMIGASDDDCKLLMLKKFVITFESGVIVIKHWRMHNYIRKDTYKETVYKDEKTSLFLDQNKAYSKTSGEPVLLLSETPDDEPSTNRQRTVNEPSTQDRIGKDSIGQESKDNIADLPTNYTLSKNNFDFSAYTEEERTQYFGSTTLTIAEYTVLAKYVREFALNTYCKKLKDYPDCKDRFKLVLTWAIKDDNIKKAYKEDFEGSI